MSYYFEENRWGERYLPDINRDTFAETTSNDVYYRDLDLDLSPKDTLHLIIGSDSGLMLRYLQQNLNAPGSLAIVIEIDDVMPYVNNEYKDMLALGNAECSPPKVALLNADLFLNSGHVEVYKTWYQKMSIQIHRSHCCYSDVNGQYTVLFRQIRLSATEQQIKLQQSLGLQRFTEVQLVNAADNVTRYHDSSNLGNGKVAVVLAGGPSLEEHMAWIMENRESLFIIAISRLCKKLLERNLKPDMVVAIDPLPYMYEVSKHGVLWNDVPLVHSYHLAPALLQQWQGPHYFIGDQLPWEQFTSKAITPVISTGPTVGHTGAIVAGHLGFSTILLAGADFCFSALGGTHVKGTPEEALQTLPSGYDAQVTTYSGRTAGTNIVLLRSIEAMNAVGKHINKDTTRLYNMSSEATRIDSIPLISKEEIILGGAKPIYACTEIYKPTLAGLANLGRELQDAKRAFISIMDICKKALVCVDYIYEKNGRQVTPAHHKRLKNLEAKLSKFDHHLKTIKHYKSTDLMRLQTPAGFEQMSRSEMENWARSYYGILSRGAKQLLPFISIAQEKVTLRKLELSGTSSSEDLISRWNDDDTPGRVLMLDAEAAESCRDKEIILQATSNYNASLSANASEAKRPSTHVKTTINNCINSVLFLFNNNNSEELTTLLSTISVNEWPNNALVYLIDGLTHELAMDKDAAAALYQSAVDICSEAINDGGVDMDTASRLIETLLIRMAQCFLSQNNGPDAELALAMLSQVSHRYTCSYAKVLEMLSRPEDAIAQVELYIEQCPADWRAIQQLSDHYRQLGANESAELASQLASDTRAANLSNLKQAA